MATIKEIAKAAGVSIGTVDRVLHDRGMVNAETKARVKAVMEELHYQPNHVAQGLAVRKKKLKIAFFIPDTSGHPFFTDVHDAAMRKAKELEQYGVKVRFYQLRQEGGGVSLDGTEVRRAIKEQDGFVMMGMDLPEVRKCLREMKNAGKPVVFYNAWVENEEYPAYVGCNYIEAGRLAAGLSVLAGGENARVCIYSEGGTEVLVSSFAERMRGFREEAKRRYPAMQILDVRGIGRTQKENEQIARQMFLDFPDVNLVYVINPADYGICREIARADKKRQVRIITNDLVAEQRGLMQEGVISATVCQEPEKQGERSLDILFRYLAYGIVPEERMNYTNLSIHIAQNSET